MKNIYLINFPTKDEGFGLDLSCALKKRGVKCESADAVDFLMDIGNGSNKKPKLINFDSEKHLSNQTLFFMKKRKPYPMYSSILLQFVSMMGAKHLNKKFIEHHKNVDKQSQYVNLVGHGFRIPHTALVHGPNIEKFKTYIEKNFTYPFVIKASGSGGKSVWKVQNFEEVMQNISASSSRRIETVVIQEYIKSSEEEYRLVFCYGEVVASIVRSSVGFYNNHAQGAEVSTKVFPENEIMLCKKAAEISGMDYLAVDYMKDENGEIVFTELQSGPSLTVSKLAEPTVVDNIAEVLISEKR